MRISLNWLKDYLEIKPDQDVSQLADALTRAGLEVESVEYVSRFAKNLVLGTIAGIVSQNNGQTIYEGQLANGQTIQISGPQFLSNGVIVALVRLQTCDQADYAVADFSFFQFNLGQGIYIILDPSLFEGQLPANLAMVNNFDDVIFTLSVTPNRSDALSHLGISRELSALLDINAKLPMLTPKEMAGPTHEKVAIEIENSDDCPRYACRIIENVLVTESPWWLKLRLISLGIRPINNVVDVTNYVMLSRGQPMHAFDFGALKQENGRAKIQIRRAVAGEKLVLLDDKEITLEQSDIVVSDNHKVLALAGVMGGKASAVSSHTNTILLESAYFSPSNIRYSAHHHHILSESSYRFERGTDPNGVMDALNYAARLLSEISDARVGREPIDAYRKRIDPIEIKMRPERAQAILGIKNEDFDQDLIRKKFLRLGIETIAKRGDAIYFRVPTYRIDLTREIDLIEEAVRMIGYDKVHDSYQVQQIDCDRVYNKKSDQFCNKLSQSLIARGFFEAINYSFLPYEFQDLFIKSDHGYIELKNPLSERYGVLRQSLIPGLVRNLIHNQNSKEKCVQLFEIGTAFLRKNPLGLKPNPEKISVSLHEDSYCIEKKKLALLLAGKDSLIAFDYLNKSFDFYTFKGVIADIFSSLGIRIKNPWPDLVFAPVTNSPFLHPGEAISVSYNNGKELKLLGYGGRLHPEIAASLEINLDTFVSELCVDDLASAVPDLSPYKSFSRYPIIERDVAFVVNEEIKVGDLLILAEKVAGARQILLDVRVFDLYQGKNIGDGKKSLAIGISLQHPDRTLTDEEALDFVDEWVRLAEGSLNAKIR